ncbi:Na/Pi symporter [Proteiniborus sp. MB09-C3]|uniref:Na/Pi cotransporter family protein n=1 Tax=Proteiniborus sp. MB09-C3 TaxID=3050072 RepID=UPI002555B983|nr:Na/Pi symporter [Proteiniborus sp. MB09-C3]WIV11439.1 Na/Pi symporter [Proteiniborus sp. MB09-C3]
MRNIYLVSFLGIAGGLTLFLFGISQMSKSFEGVISYKIKHRIDKITSSKIGGVFIGIFITALLHSSSATTIIVISLVHGNLLSIYNSIPIIMGANIGTTFTAQLLAFEVQNISIYLFMAGILLMIVLRNKKHHIIWKIVLSLAFIFAGMDVITYSISQIKSTKFFFSIIRYLSRSKGMSILAGFILTAVIQSSTTGITILQVMTASNIISIESAIPIILGQNIGTCVDTVIGSLATNKVGKQAAFVHVLFNLSGVIIFYFLIDYFCAFVVKLSPNNPARQIANAHTIFNIVTTIILLPFSSILLYISQKVIGEK